MFSDKYKKWVADNNINNLTNVQHNFAEFLLLNENAEKITKIGDLTKIYYSVVKWLKDNPNMINYNEDDKNT